MVKFSKTAIEKMNFKKIISDKNELKKTIPIYAAEKNKKLNFLLSLFMSFNYMIWGDA